MIQDVQTGIYHYLIAANQAGLSKMTVRQYDWHLVRLASWLSGQGCEQLGQISREQLRRWGAELRESWAPATIKQAICAARAFFRWCHVEDLIEEDVGQALKLPNVPQRVQRTMTAVEVQKMLEICDPKMVKGIRDMAMILLLIDTGLRAAELCGIQLDNLFLEDRYLVTAVKGGDQDFVFFGETTVERLRAWLEVRAAEEGEPALFVSVGGNTPGQALTTRGLRSILKRLGEAAGIDGVTPHAFRRGFACIAIQAGAPTRAVQLAGRWGNLQMVERYTAALGGRLLFERGWSPAGVIERQFYL